MRQTMQATALLILFGAHIMPPGGFTPTLVAHGVRECGQDEKCVKDCRGDANCQRGCRRTCR